MQRDVLGDLFNENWAERYLLKGTWMKPERWEESTSRILSFFSPPPPFPSSFPLIPLSSALAQITLIFLWSLFQLQPDLPCFCVHHTFFSLPSDCFLMLPLCCRDNFPHCFYQLLLQGVALLLPSVRSSPCCTCECSHTHIWSTDAFDRACWLVQNGCCLL